MRFSRQRPGFVTGKATRDHLVRLATEAGSGGFRLGECAAMEHGGVPVMQIEMPCSGRPGPLPDASDESLAITFQMSLKR